MTLEALASSSLPAFVVYETISASSTQNFPRNSNHVGGVLDQNDNMGSVMAFERDMALQDPSKNGGGGGGIACGGHARRKRRRRQRNCKNKEEAENQRMTHIAVERNRRRLMNEHLAVLRSLMPESYIQRGDQASVVGGAIDFVKELEQHLQSLEVQKRAMQQQKKDSCANNAASHHGFEQPPFSQFFAYPQYALCHTQPDSVSPTAVGDIEVTLIETHANLRILTHRRPRQLLKMVAGLQTLRLSILHLNVTTVEAMVLYSISVKVEEGCNLTTVDDIAAAAHHLLTLLNAEMAAASPIV